MCMQTVYTTYTLPEIILEAAGDGLVVPGVRIQL